MSNTDELIRNNHDTVMKEFSAVKKEISIISSDVAVLKNQDEHTRLMQEDCKKRFLVNEGKIDDIGKAASKESTDKSVGALKLVAWVGGSMLALLVAVVTILTFVRSMK